MPVLSELASEVIIDEILFHASHMEDIDPDHVEDIMIDSECIAYLRTKRGDMRRWQLSPGTFFKMPGAGSEPEWIKEVAECNEEILACFPDYSQEKIQARTKMAIAEAGIIGMMNSLFGKDFHNFQDFQTR